MGRYARSGLGGLGLILAIIGGILMVIYGILRIVGSVLTEINTYTQQFNLTLIDFSSGTGQNAAIIQGVVALILGLIVVYAWKNKNSSIRDSGDLIVWGIIFIILGLIAGSFGGLLVFLGGLLLVIDGLV